MTQAYDNLTLDQLRYALEQGDEQLRVALAEKKLLADGCMDRIDQIDQLKQELAQAQAAYKEALKDLETVANEHNKAIDKAAKLQAQCAEYRKTIIDLLRVAPHEFEGSPRAIACFNANALLQRNDAGTGYLSPDEAKRREAATDAVAKENLALAKKNERLEVEMKSYQEQIDAKLLNANQDISRLCREKNDLRNEAKRLEAQCAAMRQLIQRYGSIGTTQAECEAVLSTTAGQNLLTRLAKAEDRLKEAVELLQVVNLIGHSDGWIARRHAFLASQKQTDPQTR